MSQRIEIFHDKKMCYPILIESNWNSLALELDKLGCKSRKICVITDKTVEDLYYKDVNKAITAVSKICVCYSVTEYEHTKTMETVLDVIKFLHENHFERKDLIIALGGGAVSDLAGFVSSIYMRGIDYIQVPTSLLAQADSSVGGKTGINFDGGFNLIGSFKMASLVYINPTVLETLDNRNYFSGFAEVMKLALIRDAQMYEWLITNMYEICEKDASIIEEMLLRSTKIKKFYIEKDPSDKAERMALSLGHTIGYAIQTSKNEELLHGECVALGIVCAAYISWKKSFLSMEEYYEIRDMFVPFYLPISVDNLDCQKVLEYTKSDKKINDGVQRFVLLKKIGKSFIDSTVTDQEILDALNEINFTEEDERE